MLLPLSILLAPVLADTLFKSRPDLTIPVWNISSNYKDQFENVYDGYVFVTPYSADTPKIEESVEQPGAYIYTSSGELVWSSFSYFGGVSLNFQAARIGGEDVLYGWEGQFSARGGHGFGHIKILNDHYEPVREIKGGDHKLIDIHEFHLAENGKTGLIESYSPVQYDLSDFDEDGNSKRSWIVNAVVQELDIETNELIFEWKSLDHVSPDHSVLNLTSELAGDGYTSGSAWDYFHINSVDKNADGDYLVSSRHTSTIYKISGETGEILWRLSTSGDSDLKIVGKKFTLGYQHHARFIKRVDDDVEIFSFFDNNAYSKGHSEPESANPDQLSSGKILKVNNKEKTVELLQQFDPPKDHPISAKSQGSFQFLPNGNKFINWGSAGTITEYNSEGEVLFSAKLDSFERGPYVQSYRAFKYQWTGYSTEDIAIVQEDDTVYISWNGDTITETWELVDPETKRVIATSAKTGFETSLKLNHHQGGFIVRALDKNGGVYKESNYGVSEKSSSILNWLAWKQLFLSASQLF